MLIHANPCINNTQKTHLIEGKCLMTTSKAWTVSKGTLGSRPASASCRACKLTQDTHLMDTLKLRSLPSPGMVTSSSTCVVKKTETMLWYFNIFSNVYAIFQRVEILLWQVVLKNTYFVSAYGQGHGSVEILPPVIHWLSITKYLCFKVLDHMLHNFTENKMKQTNEHNA